MNPAIVMLIVEAFIKYGPQLAMKLVELFEKQTVTKEDFDNVFKLAEKSYEDYTRK